MSTAKADLAVFSPFYSEDLMHRDIPYENLDFSRSPHGILVETPRNAGAETRPRDHRHTWNLACQNRIIFQKGFRLNTMRRLVGEIIRLKVPACPLLRLFAREYFSGLSTSQNKLNGIPIIRLG